MTKGEKVAGALGLAIYIAAATALALLGVSGYIVGASIGAPLGIAIPMGLIALADRIDRRR
jgi:hypothetical protein